MILSVALTLGCSSQPDAGGPRVTATSFSELVPRAADAEQATGAYVLPKDCTISVPSGDAELSAIAEKLAAVMRRSTGYAVPVDTGGSDVAAIRLSLSSDLASLGEEGYELRVDASGIAIRAPAPTGVFYGTQTLRQLLPARIEGSAPDAGPWAVAMGVIRDQPRYAWRGLMLDVARHFFGLDELRRYVDLIALYKLNRLHLHLTDDQGWRIEIKAWPALTEVGAQNEVGGGPGGFYTQAELSELMAYAAERYVVVVPEIDMPGHVNAALASIPELNCDGQAPPPYTGTAVGISSLCIGLPITDQFVDDVISELAAITPGPWIHIGGDEAAQTSEPDYASFITTVSQKIQAHGKTMVGWEEIAKAVVGSGTIAQHWKDGSLASQAAASGADVVLSPATRCYLDMKYDLHSTPGKGTIWAGVVDVPTAYDWDPGTFVAGLPAERILGIEAAVWTETLSTPADLDVMVFPRLIGHAELAWSPWEGHDLQTYLDRLGAQGPRLDALGVGYFVAPEVPWGKAP